LIHANSQIRSKQQDDLELREVLEAVCCYSHINNSPHHEDEVESKLCLVVSTRVEVELAASSLMLLGDYFFNGFPLQRVSNRSRENDKAAETKENNAPPFLSILFYAEILHTHKSSTCFFNCRLWLRLRALEAEYYKKSEVAFNEEHYNILEEYLVL
jgi:hypothetical protein